MRGSKTFQIISMQVTKENIPETTSDVNAMGTLRMLEAIRQTDLTIKYIRLAPVKCLVKW